MVYEKQKEIFIFIFEYYSTNWKFIPGYINLRNLSRIWNTPERENYLLNYIRKPENNNYIYKVDELSDDELFIADLMARTNMTEEEAFEALDR